MTLEENIALIRKKIASAALEVGRDPGEISLLAATKAQSDAVIRAAIAAGVTLCGENRVQEMTAHLNADAYAGAGLHFIGHLQRNKVRQVVGRVDLIQSVDSPRLLEAIQGEAARLALVQDILLEVNIAGEAGKSGAAPGDLDELVRLALSLPHVRLRGLMAIPPPPGPQGNRRFFREMFQLYVDIKRKMVDNDSNITCLSMGMSGDYPDAVREGATLVRVGSALFGARPPKTLHTDEEETKNGTA